MKKLTVVLNLLFLINNYEYYIKNNLNFKFIHYFTKDYHNLRISEGFLGDFYSSKK